MNIETLIQVFAPFIGIIIAVLSVSLPYFFTKRNQLRVDECRLKEESYLNLIKALSENVNSNDDEAKRKLSNAHNHVLLIGSSDVVVNLRRFAKLTKC